MNIGYIVWLYSTIIIRIYPYPVYFWDRSVITTFRFWQDIIFRINFLIYWSTLSIHNWSDSFYLILNTVKNKGNWNYRTHRTSSIPGRGTSICGCGPCSQSLRLPPRIPSSLITCGKEPRHGYFTQSSIDRTYSKVSRRRSGDVKFRVCS